VLPRAIDIPPPTMSKEERRASEERDAERRRLWHVHMEGVAAYEAGWKRCMVPYTGLDRRYWLRGWNEAYRWWKRGQKGLRARGDYSAWPPVK